MHYDPPRRTETIVRSRSLLVGNAAGAGRVTRPRTSLDSFRPLTGEKVEKSPSLTYDVANSRRLTLRD